MNNTFYRKIGFGIRRQSQIPTDPLSWAFDQVDEDLGIKWPMTLPSSESLRVKYSEFRVAHDKTLRDKHKNSRVEYEQAVQKLKWELGASYWENLELSARHYSAINSDQPFFERLWWFWGNHFTVVDKDWLPQFLTGAYQREVIRPKLEGNFADLLFAATTALPMLHSLDNRFSVGPDSKFGRSLKNKGKTPTINENHARELLELHTVSSETRYSQDDIKNMAYIMTGWENPWPFKPTKFNKDMHQPGRHSVLGKAYESKSFNSKPTLEAACQDLAVRPETAKHIAFKLVRHFISDNPTSQMTSPIEAAWMKSGGHLPTVHKKLAEIIFRFKDQPKFQQPEVWLVQVANILGIDWPMPASMFQHDFKFEPSEQIKLISFALNELGHSPYRAKQPNGFSDIAEDWISPELLIRRLAISRRVIEGPAYKNPYKQNQRQRYFDIERIVALNFKNPDEINSLLSKVEKPEHKLELLLSSEEMLFA